MSTNNIKFKSKLDNLENILNNNFSRCIKNELFNIFSFLNFKDRFNLSTTNYNNHNIFKEYPHNEIINIDKDNYKLIDRYKNINFRCEYYPLFDNNININNLRNLHTLIIKCCNYITDLSIFKNQNKNKINKLVLHGCTNIKDVSLLGDYKYLDLSYCYKIKDVSNLGNCETLILRSCYNIKDVSMLDNVKFLNLSFCTKIKELYINKDDFKIWNNYKLNLSYTNISDVSMLINTKILNLTYCKNITNIIMLKNIKKISIFHCVNIPVEQVSFLKKYINNISYYSLH